MPRSHSLIDARAAFGLAVLAILVGMLASSRSGGVEYPALHVSSKDPQGRDAETPRKIPVRGLRDVFWRVVREVSDDRVSLVAAGVTFYLLLAFFPALAAIVSLYGLVADPVDIAAHLRDMASVLPAGAFEVFSDQIQSLIHHRDSTLGIAFFVGLSIALWSSHNGTLAVFDAVNVAYEEDEKRGLLRLNLIALAFTLGAILVAMTMIGTIALIPTIMESLWLDPWKENLALVFRWPFLLTMMFVALTAVYRFGPSRQPAKLRWITWGAALSTLAWFLTTLGFSWYLNNFADYSATYGTLGSLIGFLVWTWLSVVILIVGAELNAELEHQTAHDSTTGPPLPMGVRGAYMADHMGRSVE